MSGTLEVLRASLSPQTNLTVLLETTVLAADQRSQQQVTNPVTFLKQVKQVIVFIVMVLSAEL